VPRGYAWIERAIRDASAEDRDARPSRCVVASSHRFGAKIFTTAGRHILMAGQHDVSPRRFLRRDVRDDDRRGVIYNDATSHRDGARFSTATTQYDASLR